MRLKQLCLWLCVVSACGSPSGDRFRTLIVDSSNASEPYRLREKVIGDVLDLGSMRGRTLEFFAAPQFSAQFLTSDGKCFVNGTAPCNGDPQALREAVTPKGILRVQTQLATDGSLVRALDFDTLNVLTAYALLSDADTYFRAKGWATERVAPVWYFPKAQGLLSLQFPSSDNAAYFQYIDGFILFPMRVIDGVPLGMNRGVMFHEYHHRVFASRVYDGNIFKTVDLFSESPEGLHAINRLKAVDEGAADFFGAIGSQDPNFLARSIAGDIGVARDLRTKRVFDAAWIPGDQPVVEDLLSSSYDPYIPGSVFAHGLWRLREELGEDSVVKAWFNVETKVHDDMQLDALRFQYSKVVEFLAQEFDAQQRTRACAVLREVFAVLMSEVPTCSL